MWGLCAHLSSHLSLSEPPGEWWSPWKFGDSIQEPLPRPVDLHVHFFLKVPFKSISHFAQINIWNLGHVILLFKKKNLLTCTHNELFCDYNFKSTYSMENTYGKCIFTGSLAAWIGRDFCRCCWFLFLSVTGITGPSSDFYVNFLLVTPGSKNSNPKPVCGAGMITSFQQRPFLYLVLNFLACAHTCAFLVHFFPEPCGLWRAGA